MNSTRINIDLNLENSDDVCNEFDCCELRRTGEIRRLASSIYAESTGSQTGLIARFHNARNSRNELSLTSGDHAIKNDQAKAPPITESHFKAKGNGQSEAEQSLGTPESHGPNNLEPGLPVAPNLRERKLNKTTPFVLPEKIDICERFRLYESSVLHLLELPIPEYMPHMSLNARTQKPEISQIQCENSQSVADLSKTKAKAQASTVLDISEPPALVDMHDSNAPDQQNKKKKKKKIALKQSRSTAIEIVQKPTTFIAPKPRKSIKASKLSAPPALDKTKPPGKENMQEPKSSETPKKATAKKIPRRTISSIFGEAELNVLENVPASEQFVSLETIDIMLPKFEALAPKKTNSI